MNTVSRAGILLSLAVLMSGCIRIDATQTVGKTGETTVELLVDLSKLADMSDSMEEEIGNSLSIGMYGQSASSSSAAAQDFNCAEFQARQQTEPSTIAISNMKCVDKAPNIILISGTQKMRRSEFVRRKAGKKTMYLYKLQNANRLMAPDKTAARTDPQPDAAAEKFGKDLVSSILQGTFTVVMPGRITKSPGGVIAGNRVTFDVVDFPLKKSGFIQSEE